MAVKRKAVVTKPRNIIAFFDPTGVIAREYKAACKALGTNMASDLRAHALAVIADWKKRFPHSYEAQVKASARRKVQKLCQR